MTTMNSCLRIGLALLLIGGLALPTSSAHAQQRTAPPAPAPSLSPQDPDDCRNGDEECDPAGAILGTVFAEFLPQLVDGVRAGPVVTPGGGAFSGRVEWTLREQSDSGLDLGVGAWIVPRRVKPGEDALLDRNGALALSLTGTTLLYDPNPASRSTVRGLLEATALWTDRGSHVRLSAGPRYALQLGTKIVSFDLQVGTDVFGGADFTPHAGLRVGLQWD